MKLHYSPSSSNSQRVLAVAADLEIPVQLEQVDLAAGHQRTPAFLALNPNGKVPVLEHDDLVLWESTAIINYLAETAENQRLWPQTPRERAELFKWQAWTLNHFVRVSDVFLFENVIKGFFGLGAPDPTVLSSAHDEMCDLYKLLDSVLETRPFMQGEVPSLADHHLYPAFNIREHLNLPSLVSTPHLAAWTTSMSKTLGWKSLNL
jgi:glutathione S-transferase